MKAIRVQTVAFDAKCNHKNPLHRRHAARFGHTVLGTLLGTHGAFFDRSVRKTEGKRAKATVSLTVAFFTGSHRIVSLGRSVGRLVDGRQYNYPTASKIVHDVNTLVYAAIVN